MTQDDGEGAPDILVLTDPKALRALAHPVRQQVLDLFDVNNPMTATEAARRIGITPSAMSYHLRALEKWGIVERVAAGGDGRERPWRMAARSIRINPTEAAGNPGVRAFVGSVVDRLVEALERADEAPGRGHISTARMLLTDAEAQEVSDALQAALAPYEGRRSGDAEVPADARQFNVFFFAVADRQED